MPKKRRQFDAEFREGVGRVVRETGKPIAQVACVRHIGGTCGDFTGMACTLRVR
jgi:transposase